MNTVCDCVRTDLCSFDSSHDRVTVDQSYSLVSDYEKSRTIKESNLTEGIVNSKLVSIDDPVHPFGMCFCLGLCCFSSDWTPS